MEKTEVKTVLAKSLAGMDRKKIEKALKVLHHVQAEKVKKLTARAALN